MRSQTHSDLGSANDGHKHAKRSQKNSNLAIALTVTHQYGIERTSALRPTRPLLLRNKDDEIPRIWPWGFPQRTAATDASCLYFCIFGGEFRNSTDYIHYLVKCKIISITQERCAKLCVSS